MIPVPSLPELLHYPNQLVNYSADSGTVISISHKIDVVFMSVLVEMQRRIDELEST